VPSLQGFTGAGYERGRPLPLQAAWYVVSNLIFVKWWFPMRLRPRVLRAFGAVIGEGVLIRPRVRIHWPWKLLIGDHCWIGEGAWLLNLEPINIGNDVCISQDAFLCTGSHDRHSPTFEFDNRPITIDDEAWIAARAVVLRGVRVGRAAVVGAGAVAYADLAPGSVVTPSTPTRRPEPAPATAATGSPGTSRLSP
jgi:putative colanic acid biosynthesis acetyltransferase WcaF